jgi:hypothetical protein
VPRHRSFSLGPAPTPADNVTFDLSGERSSNPEDRWTETFTCVGLAPAGVLEDLTSAIRVDPTTGMRRYDTLSCMAFVRAVLVPEDTGRFELLLHDTDRVVGLIDLVQVVAWLSDELTLRPTRPLSVSTPGGGQRDGAATPVGAAT